MSLLTKLQTAVELRRKRDDLITQIQNIQSLKREASYNQLEIMKTYDLINSFKYLRRLKELRVKLVKAKLKETLAIKKDVGSRSAQCKRYADSFGKNVSGTQLVEEYTKDVQKVWKKIVKRRQKLAIDAFHDIFQLRAAVLNTGKTELAELVNALADAALTNYVHGKWICADTELEFRFVYSVVPVNAYQIFKSWSFSLTDALTAKNTEELKVSLHSFNML